jgi:hypothetical protein
MCVVCILVGLDLLATFACEAMILGTFGIVAIIGHYDLAYV